MALRLVLGLTLLPACSLYFGEPAASHDDVGPDDAAIHDGVPSTDAPGDAGVMDAPGDADVMDAPDGGPSPGANAVEVLDLGHGDTVTSLERSPTRVLSGDWSKHWVLWDATTRAKIASGAFPCPWSTWENPSVCAGEFLTLAGDVFLVAVTPEAGGSTMAEVRSAVDGTLLSSVHNQPDVGLTSDGAYVWIASSSSLAVQLPNGTPVFSITGNYSQAQVKGNANALLVVGGPAGASQLERVDLTTHGKTVTSFSGTFAAWFEDGSAFATKLGDVVWIYSASGAQLAIGTPPITPLGGYGNYVWGQSTNWMSPYTIEIYKTSQLDSLAGSITGESYQDRYVAAGSRIGHLAPYSGTVQITTLGTTVETGPIIVTPYVGLEAFAADAAGNWVAASDGAVFDGVGITIDAANIYSLGRVRALAGTGGTTGAIGTASGRIVLLAVGTATTVSTTITTALTSKLALTADGARLVATGDLRSAQYARDMSLRVFATSDGSLVHMWPYSWPSWTSPSTPRFVDFSFAAEGDVLCQLVDTGSAYDRFFTDTDGNTLSSRGPGCPRMSPDGSHALSGTYGPYYDSSSMSDVYHATTQVYADGALVTAVPGVGLAWIDNDHFLVATYAFDGAQTGVKVYDTTGAITSTATLPNVRGALLVSLGGTLLYVPPGYLPAPHGEVLDYATGNVVWQGHPRTFDGVPVGDDILYTVGEKVYADRFR